MRRVANRLAADGYVPVLLLESGAAVDVADKLGGIGVEGSVTDTDDLTALVEIAQERYGCIGAVVNNTGHPAKGDLLDISDEEWHEGLDPVLLGTVGTSQLTGDERLFYRAHLAEEGYFGYWCFDKRIHASRESA